MRRALPQRAGFERAGGVNAGEGCLRIDAGNDELCFEVARRVVRCRLVRALGLALSLDVVASFLSTASASGGTTASSECTPCASSAHSVALIL